MRRRSFSARRFAALWIVAASLLAGVLTWALLPNEVVAQVTSESGPVETATAVAFGFCGAAVWLLRRGGVPRATVAALSTLMLAFGARELDWHKAFTGTSVLRLSWYAGAAPWPSKPLAAAVLLLVIAAAWHLLRRHAKPVWLAMRRGEALATTSVTFVATMVVSKAIDRSLGILQEDFGVVTSPSIHALRGAVEEWLELALPAMVLLALWQRLSSRR